MPQIEISDADYARLKALAEPFVDTPATVIGRLLDWYRDDLREPLGAQEKSLPMMLTEVPPLTHTKLLSSTLEGRAPQKNAWDSLLVAALNAALEKLGDVDDLKRVSGANITIGRKETDGYKFVNSLGYSYQGVSAEDSIKIVRRICRHFNWRCDIDFEWRQKDDAFLPGKRAHLHIYGDFVNGGVD